MASGHQRSRFLHECLERTNEHRNRHGVPPLTLNPRLSSIAQAWADHLLRSDRLQHNPKARHMDAPLGENVAFNYKSSEEVKGSEMIDQWYNEIKDYNFNNHSSSRTTGHFTQLVWKNSREVGFGLAASHGKHYLVANYFPAGNYVGQNRENVFPPQSGGGVKADKSPQRAAHRSQVTINPASCSDHPQTLSFPRFDWSFKLPSDDTDSQSRSWRAAGSANRPSHDAKHKPPCREEPPWAGARASNNAGNNNSINYGAAYGVSGGSDSGFLSSDRFALISLSDRCTPAPPRRIDLDPGSRAGNSSTLIVTETYAYGDGSNGHVSRSVQRFTNVPAQEVEKRSWTGSLAEQRFSDEILSGHNRLRTRHKAPNLTLNPTISRMAQSWAEKLARDGEMSLSGNKHLGQTLGEGVAMKYSSLPVDYEASELLDKWYAEKGSYNFKHPNESSGVDRSGHFTQMVWRDSRELGVGRAWSRDSTKVFVVCNYFPAGNVTGSFKENVLQ